MATHITKRYDFNTICAGILRMIEKPDLYQKYKEYLDAQYFFYNDISPHSRALRKLIEVLADMEEQGKTSDMTMNSVESFMAYGLPESEISSATKELFTKMRREDAILSRATDPACFREFLDYLKVLRIAKHAGPMFSEYQSGKIDEAVKHMTQALAEINQIQDPAIYSFDVDQNYDDIMLGKNVGYIQEILPLGCSEIDSALGGGFETQTFNGFVSVPNGGKSTMCHHLIKQCFKHRKHVHVTCVEDRAKSFLSKLTSSLTGIPVWKLKRNYQALPQSDLNKIAEAKELMKTYLKVDFVYGQNVDTIHKAKLDHDLACKAAGKPAPIVDIIDYTGHISGRTFGDKMYEKMRNAYGARKDFVLANNKIGFDFAQINREGLKYLNTAGGNVLTMADLAGSFDIAQVFDNLISINRSEDDQKKQEAILHICKSRDGEAGGKFRVKTDFSTARWMVDDYCVWENATVDLVRNLQETLAKEDEATNVG